MPTIDPTSSAGVQPTIPGASGYTLIMSDEFNSSALDSKWRLFHDYGNFGVPSNFDLNASGNSRLRIWPDAPSGYQNFAMDSLGPNQFTSFFGVYEAKIKQCRGRGMFPSFWAVDAFLSQPLKPEIDFYECYGYDGGGWNNGASNGWRPTNAAWTAWYNGGGNTGQSGTLKLTDANACTSPFAAIDLSAADHIFTCKVAPAGLTFYFDNQQWGCVLGLPWTQAEMDANPLSTVFDLWWNMAGLPAPNATDTPSGPTNAMEVDYVRVWALPGSSGGGGTIVTATFNCALSIGPPDGATIFGTRHLEAAGNLIGNVELVSTATASTTLYGRFTVNSGGTLATLDWDTNGVPSSTRQFRVLAYDQPPGVTANVITAMATRTWTIANSSVSDMPVLNIFDISF